MAVWGIGAYYKGLSPADKTAEFLNDGCAYIGWDETDASALYRMFDSIKIGDIIYVKSFVPKTKKLHIKAIGIVTSTDKKKSHSLGTGISVKWKADFMPITIAVTPQIFRNNVFNNTLFEEFNGDIICKIIEEIMANSTLLTSR